MQNTPFKKVIALTNVAADLYNPGTTTGGVNSTAAPMDKLYGIIKGISVCDKGGAGGSFTLYIGATGGSAAGTEIAKAVNVPANSVVQLPVPSGGWRFGQADFLTGLAAANTTLVITINGEQGIGA